MIIVNVFCDHCSHNVDVAVNPDAGQWPVRRRCEACKQPRTVVIYCEMLPPGTPHIMNGCYCQRVAALRAAGVIDIGSKLLHGWSIETLEHSAGIR